VKVLNYIVHVSRLQCINGWVNHDQQFCLATKQQETDCKFMTYIYMYCT